jgi:hypothetical protein
MLCWATGLLLAMAVAPTAGADTFCVDRPGCADAVTNS